MIRFVRSFAFATAALLVVSTSCNDQPTAPKYARAKAITGVTSKIIIPSVVISQVYGGGGNAGAQFKNDFIELFNPTPDPVDVTGWSVQYASSAGTTWAVTNLTGVIQSGAYYLVQEAVGNNAALPALPAPEATGAIAMSANAGKVFLSNSTTALSGACPTAASVIDKVSFGTAATDCGYGTTATLANTTAAIRNSGGCSYIGSMASDFSVAAPTPRNHASPTNVCSIGGVPVSVTVTPGISTIFEGGTQSFVAGAVDAFGHSTSTAVTWSSSSAAIVSIDANGVATSHAAGSVVITATTPNNVSGTATLSVTHVVDHSGELVVSQIYGGGGNAGATLKNDFIEIFNRSASPLNVDGWSVQQTSSTGTSWNVTPISGTIPAGGYYLVKEAAGEGGTVDLPTPDATGTAVMGATNGKVLIAQMTTAFTTACPNSFMVVDLASYGTGTNCGNSAPAPSNTNADLRKHAGCTYTPNPTLDFATGAPTPRNSATAAHSCVPGPLDHVAISGSSTVLAGNTTQLTAEGLDVNDNGVPGQTVTWSTDDASIATVSATGLVTGVTANSDGATITATVVAGGITKTSSLVVIVNNPGGINWIDLSFSTTSIPPGFQGQIFGTARESQGGTIIKSSFAFEAMNPAIATIQTMPNTGVTDPNSTTNGLFLGVAAPSDGTKPGFKVTATPVGGGTSYSFITHSVTIEQPVPAPLSAYGNNDAFGDPSPADATHPNDFLIRRNQYVLSYNQSRGTPNWVSWELDSRQRGGEDRCNCFTLDTLLPPSARINSNDYTNSGYDRGHMAPSADRTAGNVDNAITFYLTNIVPQIGDLNQGVWGQFENAIRDSVSHNRAAYIITGPIYSRPLTFIKNEGKVAIPDSTWKVVLFGPANSGNPFTSADVQNWSDLTGLSIVAVNMPNITGIRNDPPSKYYTTVTKIEQSTGFNILSLLQTTFQVALENKDHAPIPHFAVSGTQVEGSAVTLDASASTDADSTRTDMDRAESLTYTWQFNDGTSATGAVVTKTFANDGNFTATLTVTDAFGWPATASSNVAIANVAPSIAPIADATVQFGGTYAASGSFTDPGSDSWTGTVNYGDGSPTQTLALSGHSFSLSHAYASAGSFTVTITVSDDDATATSTATVTMLTPQQTLANISAAIDQLALNGGNANALKSKIDAAIAQLDKGNTTPAKNQLQALLNQITAFQRAGNLSVPDAAALRAAVLAVLGAL